MSEATYAPVGGATADWFQAALEKRLREEGFGTGPIDDMPVPVVTVEALSPLLGCVKEGTPVVARVLDCRGDERWYPARLRFVRLADGTRAIGIEGNDDTPGHGREEAP